MTHTSTALNNRRKSILITSLLLAGALVAPSLQSADFGDAPDGTDTFYPVDPGNSAVIGQFPTLLLSNGARHANLTDCWLGGPGSAPSSEADANDPTDPDGLANLVNNDANDDGLPVIPFYFDLNSATPTATVTVKITVAAGAPDIPRVLNMLIDWDQSGNWQNPTSGAPEWAVNNYAVNVTPGTTELISIPITWDSNAGIFPQIFWTRLTLSQSPIFPASFSDGWDGSGSFSYGETEDFLFHPNLRHDASPSPWVAPTNPAPGGGPGSSLPSISLLPASQPFTHGIPATVTVNLDNGPAPDSLEWAIDPAPRGSASFDAGLAQQAFGGSYSVSGSTATATAGGTLPTLGSVTITSTVDARTPAYEEWPIRVQSNWNGNSSQTAKSVVRIWHEGWSGVWALTEQFGTLEHAIMNTVPSGLQGNVLSFLSGAFSAYKSSATGTAIGDLFAVIFEIEELGINGDISFSDEFLLVDLADAIILEIESIDPVEFGIPVPILGGNGPQNGDTLYGTVTLEAETNSLGIVSASFFYSLDGSTWVLIGNDTTPGDGLTAPFDTTGLADGTLRLRVEISDSSISGDYEALVWVDNSVPALLPVPGSSNVGITHVQIPESAGNIVATLFEISYNGSDWHAVGTDSDTADGQTTVLDTGQLRSGTYSLRATATYAGGNSAQNVWSFDILPSFHALRNEFGVPSAKTGDDLDKDGLSLAEEYYLGLSPTTPEAPSDYLIWEALGGSNFQYRFTPALLVDGLRAAVEESPDLDSWSDLLLDPDNSGEVVVPVDTSPRKFVRLNLWEDRQ